MLKQDNQSSQPAIPLPNVGLRIVPPPPVPVFCSIDPMPAPPPGPQL